MTTELPLVATQQRLARHYLNKLRSADAALKHGQSSTAYSLSVFDQDWEQIRHWQAWAARRSAQDEAAAQLCKAFPLAGLEVLTTRNNAADHALWLNSALVAAQQLHDGEAERTLCNELAMTYYRLGVLENVEHFARRLLTLAEEANDVVSSERAVLLLGVFADERGQYEEAERHYARALQIAEEHDLNEERMRALNGLGAIAMYRGDYATAYPYFVRQLEMMEEVGRKSGICHALIAMGRVLIELKDYSLADAYLQRAVRLCRTFGFQRLLGVGLLNLGSSAAQQSQLQAACSYFEEGIAVVRGTNTQRQIIRGLALLGDTQLRLGELTEALAHLQEGLQLARAAGLPRHICDLQRSLTNTYLILNDLAAARCALQDTLTLAQSLGSHPQKTEAILSAVTYFLRLELPRQAAILAGVISDDPTLDHAFTLLCQQLESKLGSGHFQQALAEGKMRALDDVVSEILRLLTNVG